MLNFTTSFPRAIFIFILALVGVFYPYNRGALFTALVVIYALTSGIAGYTAASFYCQLEGKNWVRNHGVHCFIVVKLPKFPTNASLIVFAQFPYYVILFKLVKVS